MISMKTFWRRCNGPCGGFSVVVFLMALPVCAEPHITLDAPMTSVEVGEAFVVDIVIRDVPLVDSGVLTVNFDPRVIQLSGVLFPGAWDGDTAPGEIDNDVGTISKMKFATSQELRGNATIATLWFAATHPGKAEISVEPDRNTSVYGAGEAIFIAPHNQSITVVAPTDHHGH